MHRDKESENEREREKKNCVRIKKKDLNEICIVMHVALGDIIENQDKWYILKGNP